MRDIVNSNGFSASNTQTKSKVVKMPNNSSGTLTRADYRSYRDFVGSYGDNKNSKDDQESVSSTESGISSYNLSESKSNNTSTSSLNSEINGTSSKNLPKTEQNTGVASRTGSFRNYLESYNSKKFSSVKSVAPKQTTVKSEIVIQVNDPLDQQKSLKKNELVFVTTINGDVGGEDSPDSLPPPPNFLPPVSPHKKLNGHQTKGFSYLPPPPPPPFQEPKIGEQDEDGFVPPPPPPVPQNLGGCAPPPPPPPPNLSDLNKTPTGGKKWGAVEVDGHCPKPNPKSEKLPANHAAATNLAKILTQHLLPRRKELENQLNEQIVSKPTPSSPLTKVKNEQRSFPPPPPVPKLPQNGQNVSSFISLTPNVPIPSPKNSLAHSPPKMPPPPPPKSDYCTLPRQFQKITLEISPPKLPQSPPPKVASHNFPQQPKKIATMELLPPKLPQSSPPKAINGRNSPSGSVDFNTTTVVPVVSKNDPNVGKLGSNSYRFLGAYNNKANDMVATLPRTSPSKANGRNSPSGSVEFNTTTVVPVNDATSKVSKNDPNVKKLVYNTYRGLLGAYNNKANDMIATLPRSRVREDQGVSKQLESIALQGGLEKLNGRTNPNVEQDEVHNQ